MGCSARNSGTALGGPSKWRDGLSVQSRWGAPLHLQQRHESDLLGCGKWRYQNVLWPYVSQSPSHFRGRRQWTWSAERHGVAGRHPHRLHLQRRVLTIQIQILDFPQSKLLFFPSFFGIKSLLPADLFCLTICWIGRLSKQIWIDWLIDWSHTLLINWSVAWLIDWLIDWFYAFMLDWLIDWLCVIFLLPRFLRIWNIYDSKVPVEISRVPDVRIVTFSHNSFILALGCAWRRNLFSDFCFRFWGVLFNIFLLSRCRSGAMKFYQSPMRLPALKHACRIVIRRSVRESQCSDLIDLPRRLRAYLSYNDLRWGLFFVQNHENTRPKSPFFVHVNTIRSRNIFFAQGIFCLTFSCRM